jgi:hypothetical protein
MQPSIINFYIQNLSCDELEGRFYMTFNLEEECWTGTHQFLSSALTIPFLVFWMVIFPGLFLVYMIKMKRRLNEEFVYNVTKFFQMGFKPKFFYGEFLNMVRKFSIILLTTLLRNNNEVVIYILIPLMSAFFFLQNYKRPFQQERHNRLELLSLNAAFLTYYSAVFYLRSISESTKLFFISVIFISNIVYLIYWLRAYKEVIKQNVMEIVTIIKSKFRKRNYSHFNKPKTPLEN